MLFLYAILLENMKGNSKKGGASIDGYYFGNVPANDLIKITPYFNYAKAYQEFNYDNALSNVRQSYFVGGKSPNKKQNKLYKDTSKMMGGLYENYKDSKKESLLKTSKKYFGGLDYQLYFPVKGEALNNVSTLSYNEQYKYPSFEKIHKADQSPFEALFEYNS